MNTNKSWSKEIPTESGLYWFYGYPFETHDDKDEKPRMCFVEVLVNKSTSISFLVYKGTILSKKDIIGIWKEVEYPELPDGIKDVLILMEVMNGE